jgi:signal transduction histidine kinase
MNLISAESVFETLNISLASVDSSMKIIRANKPFHWAFNLAPLKTRTRTLYHLGKGMWNAEPIREKLHALARDHKPFTDFECVFEIPLLGTRTLAISGLVAAHNPREKQTFLIVVQDVTSRKQSAEAAALQKSEARQRDFVANVSHELMTPITAIKGYSEALVSGALELPNKRLKFTQIIEKHADRLSQLVEDLLHLSTAEAGHKKSVDSVLLTEKIHQLTADLGPMARKRGISIRVKMNPDLRVAVNKPALRQILQNLFQNAIKYNRVNGRIVVGASVVGKRVVVTIQDTGIGIPKEDLTKIFDRFHRASNARATTERGTGLGLSIAKSILVGHGCRIWAESELGKGTTFFFTLPKA